MMKSTTLAVFLVAWASACGGSSGPTENSVSGVVVADPNSAVGEGLPQIPEAPVSAPQALFARLSLGDPRGEMAKLASFVDAVQPGMGAVINEQAFASILSGAAGTGGLAGVDWSKPIFLLRLDQNSVPSGSLLVVGVADREALESAVSGADVQVMTHNGFACVGSKKALQVAAPYALTSLVTTEVVAEPSFVIWVERALDRQGPNMDRLFRELEFTPEEKDRALVLLRELKTITGVAHVTSSAAAVDVDIKLGEKGQLVDMVAAQTPSNFDVATRLGTGQAALLLAGDVDFSLIGPFALKLIAKADPAALPIAEAVLKTKGQMAARVVGPEPGKFAAIYTVADASALAESVNTLARQLADKGPTAVGERIATVKANRLRTSGGNIHEVNYKLDPKLSPARKKALRKKVAAKAYFGVSGNDLVAFYGRGGIAEVRKLVKPSAKGKNAPKMDEALAASKQRKETIFAGVDVAAMSNDGIATELPPVALGVQFSPQTIRVSASLPVEQARAVTQRGM